MRKRRSRHGGPGAKSMRAETRPRAGRRYGTSTIPAACGSRSRSSGRSRARTRAPRRIVTRTHGRLTRSVTFPRLATRSSSRRRRTCTPTTANRRTIFPGARTTTTTPSRMRTASPAPASGRVVSSTSSEWSPGSAPRGTRAEIATEAVAPGAIASRAGRTLSHENRRASTRGRPRRSRAKPPRAASTTAGWLPEFVTPTSPAPEPRMARCAGEAISDTGALAAPAEAEAARSAAATTSIGARHPPYRR
jgi:hypothetical protein